MTKVLVTGASGFIGKSLIAELKFRQYKTIAVSRSDGDISRKSTWTHFDRADVLIHLAASTFVPDSWETPDCFIQTNLNGTVCALDYCRQHNTKLVFLSSYLYGIPKKLPVSESAPLIASNPYALSKKLTEEVCKFYADFYGVKIIIFRPFNVYGSGQSEKFLIPFVIRQVCAGTDIFVKDIEPKRDYIYIDDLVDAIIKGVDSRLNFSIFNIGTGVSYSVTELINIIQKIKGTSLNVHADGERRTGEVMDTQSDNTKIFENLGWQPKYSLKAGLKKMLKNVDYV